MKNIDNKGRKKWVPHVRLDHSVFYSAAYRALSSAARILIFELSGLYNGRNNGEIFLSVRDAAKLMGMADTGVASRAFRELIAHGLIVLESAGTFSLKQSHASRWRLTFLPADGKAPTREFEHWEPEPGSGAAKRLRLLATCKLRSEFPRLAVLESKTLPAISVSVRADSVGESHTAIVQEPRIPVGDDVLQSPTQVYSHGDSLERASIQDCNVARSVARNWLRARGAGMQKHLAREAMISESKLSRFLKNASGRKTLTVAELRRLLEVAQKPRYARSGRYL